MIKLAESEIDVVIAANKLDADPLLLGVSNGVIDLRTVTFRAALQEDYVTKFTGTAYDPDARCPEWDKFLKKIASDELISYLKRAVGYTLTGLTGEEVMFVPWGDGSNGKSLPRNYLCLARRLCRELTCNKQKNGRRDARFGATAWPSISCDQRD
jgi:putative DNA primase/helicase